MTNPRAFIDTDALDHQAKYHPTGNYSIRERGEVKNGRVVRTAQDVQRRVKELQLWNDLDPAQIHAAEQIYRGCLAITHPVQGKTMNLMDRVDCGRRTIDPDRRIQVIDDYRAWTAECHRLNAWRSLNLCLSVFVDGNDLREAERLARIRNGTAASFLVEGLDIYCKVNRKMGHI